MNLCKLTEKGKHSMY